MRDIKLILKGDDSYIDLTSSVEGKSNTEQKCLVNLVTENGSDSLYPARGTTLLADSINGLAYDKMEAIHVANFAALDTEFFLNDVRYVPEVVVSEKVTYKTVGDLKVPDFTTLKLDQTDPTELYELTLTPVEVDSVKSIMSLTVQLKFADETTTQAIAEVPVRL